ncbi:helical backbone metal receptor [Embleya sp. MST-111070]|uniref:helical backbone metal receptor n=1 Tax=Embleya sp. MST-111070 TaxID=3398231 RepID=UPI003F738197
MRDDLDLPVPVPDEVRRVVSLVPSLTEAVAVSAPGLLVGATDWCTHPADLDVVRIRGTKNPDLDAIRALAPDLVLANEEENRPADLAALRAAGIAVWVTRVRGLDEAFTALERMLVLGCRLPAPPWLAACRAAWAGLPAAPPRRAIVPVWRRPWMVAGRDTFAADVLARFGLTNVFAQHAERWPKVSLDELRAAEPDLVVLPDEPYRFTTEDGPEAFPGLPVALVDGRHLTWYGPSLAAAPGVLAGQLAAAGRFDG